MAEYLLQCTHIHAILQHECGRCVPQFVRGVLAGIQSCAGQIFLDHDLYGVAADACASVGEKHGCRARWCDLAAYGQITVERFTAGIVEVNNTLFAALAEDAQAYNDYAQKCERFEKKLHDLELTRMVSLQMGPQTRLLQNNDTLMVEKIQSSLVNTIPLWKSQMVLALGMEHSRQATAAQSAVTETTNELLKKNADMLKMGTIATAKEAERSIVDIETLQHTNEQLVSTLDEVVNIQREGAQKRKEAEVELGRIEGELKQKLMELRS